MTDKIYPKTLSNREMREWIVGCPVQIKRIHVVKLSAEDAPNIELFITTCGGYDAVSCKLDVEYLNERREHIGSAENVEYIIGGDPLQSGMHDAVFAYVVVKEVLLSDGTKWVNENGDKGKIFPEQEVIWQTDPLYEQIKKVCSGVTEARYKPDTVEGGWRCTCGQINVQSAEECGGCGCSKEWLTAHFDENYLRSVKLEDSSKSSKSEKKKRSKGKTVHPGLKVAGAFAALALIVILVVLTFTQFIPQSRYNKAISLMESEEYDSAIEIFTGLKGFSDSEEKKDEAVYKKAQSITGLENVYIVDSREVVCFSISEDGVLGFNKDKYTGDWNSFRIPDVVDGIIVKELDRNFFMNCDKLVSVSISDCVEIIGEQAFFNCSSLTDVIFGKRVHTVRPRAFINCTSLSEIEIPDTVTTLGVRAFNNCSSLRKIVLGRGITEIGAYMFSNCKALERLTLSSPISDIGEYAFYECESLKTVFGRFSDSEWTDPTVGENNEAYLNAEIILNQ